LVWKNTIHDQSAFRLHGQQSRNPITTPFTAVPLSFPLSVCHIQTKTPAMCRAMSSAGKPGPSGSTWRGLIGRPSGLRGTTMQPREDSSTWRDESFLEMPISSRVFGLSSCGTTVVPQDSGLSHPPVAFGISANISPALRSALTLISVAHPCNKKPGTKPGRCGVCESVS
jgi:hypothetical protein